jgi:hypothetical protein
MDGSKRADDLARLNKAGAALSEEFLHFGFDRAQQYAVTYGIPESEMPIVIANAYYRLAVETNAEVFGLSGEVLGKRIMQVIKDTAREALENG